MYNIENNMPKFIQRMVHVKRAVVKPNEGTKSFLQTVCFRLSSSVYTCACLFVAQYDCYARINFVYGNATCASCNTAFRCRNLILKVVALPM